MFVVTGEPVAPVLLARILPFELSIAMDPARFEREVIMLTPRLDHPHLVGPHGAGTAGRFLYHTRPFLEGTTLRAVLQRRGELPLHHAVQVLRDVTGAVARAHANGVLHGDLRPENVLMTDAGALVVDTGIAGAAAAAIRRNHPAALALDLSDPVYRAPELRTGIPLWSEQTDIFALGAMGYEMLAGKPPVREPEPLGGRRSITPGLGQLMLQCLSERPEDRPGSMMELQGQIEHILHS